jgi:hypothetical protein
MLRAGAKESISELPDEAAAHIAEFLYELAACLEESYLAQIRHHHFESRPRDDYNPGQLDLFSFVSSPRCWFVRL